MRAEITARGKCPSQARTGDFWREGERGRERHYGLNCVQYLLERSVTRGLGGDEEATAEEEGRGPLNTKLLEEHCDSAHGHCLDPLLNNESREEGEKRGCWCRIVMNREGRQFANSMAACLLFRAVSKACVQIPTRHSLSPRLFPLQIL